MSSDADSVLLHKKISYALDELNSKRNLYRVDSEIVDRLVSDHKSNRIQEGSWFKRRNSQQIETGWLKEYSSGNMDLIN